MKLRVAVLYGGRSGEHEVSLRSAASVFMRLDRDRYTVIPVAMDKQGCFHLHDDASLYAAAPEVLPVTSRHSTPLSAILVDGRFALDVDVVFPVVHGPLYEDGALQGLLELAGVAYVGCQVLSSALGMDKDLQRRLVCIDGLACTDYRVIPAQVTSEQLPELCAQTAQALGWPLFVKPCCMGSSVGIHKVHTADELLSAVADARRYDRTVLVEAFVAGREIELAVLENSNPYGQPLVSVPGEIEVMHPDGFYSYTAKYLASEQTLLHIPAQLSDHLVQALQTAAAAAFTRLRCSGMARVDFFVDTHNNKIYFNEINTLPGFTSISMYPKLWAASGLAYPALLDQLITQALHHHDAREQLLTHYQ